MVELAMVLPVLMVLLFGILEGGLLIKDVVGLNQAAREGARVAAAGATPTSIGLHVATSAPTIDTGQVSELYEHRTCDAGGSYGEWTVLGADGAQNDADEGDQIRVTLHYPHRLVTGGMFASLADNPDGDSITVSTAITIRRE